MKSNRFFLIAVLFEAGLGLVALLIGRLSGLSFGEFCRFDIDSLQWGIGATIPTIILYFFLRALPWSCTRRITELVRRVFETEMGSLPVWKLAILAASAGFGEEFLFRGLLQKGLCNFFGGWELAVLIAVSIVFGLFHCLSKTYVVLAFLISLYLGALFLWTDNLAVPVIVHSVYDFFVFYHLRLESSLRRRRQDLFF